VPCSEQNTPQGSGETLPSARYPISKPLEEKVQRRLATGNGLVRISSFITELFEKTVEFWLELRIAARLTPLAQETKPLLSHKDEPFRYVVTRFACATRRACHRGPVSGCPHDLPFRNRHPLPYVHSLRNNQQEFVCLSERVPSMATFVKVTKESTPLFGKAARPVNPYRITAFH